MKMTQKIQNPDHNLSSCPKWKKWHVFRVSEPFSVHQFRLFPHKICFLHLCQKDQSTKRYFPVKFPHPDIPYSTRKAVLYDYFYKNFKNS